MLLGGFDSQQVMESKMKEIEKWEENKVFEEVKNMDQKAVNTRWGITEKV